MEEWIRDLSMQARAERKRYSGDIHRRLGKGARDRHTTLYRQYTDVANWFKWQTGQDRHFRHSCAGVSEQ